MKVRFTLALILFCGAGLLNAQDQYIVKLNGDTLRGKLQINPMRDNTRSMYFRYEDGTRENIRPIRISYVYYDEEIQYRSIPFFNQRLFMQIIKEGPNLNYYHYVHKRDNSVATTKVLSKPDGEVLEISAISFKKQTSEFLDDCPEISARLEAKEYKYNDLDKLFEDYNNCDIQIVSASTQNQKENNPLPEAGSTTAATAAAAGNNQDTGPADTVKQQKLDQIDAFRKYIRGLDDFEHARDVMEWLTDVEYRVSQDREIPNYLWNSLGAMTSDNEAVQQKADELKKVLEN